MASHGDDSSQPLLATGSTCDVVDPGNARAAIPAEIDPDDARTFKTQYTHHRQWLKNFLASRTQHFCVLSLVSLDLLGIFADIFINLYTCEEGEPGATWDAIRDGLGIAGLVFSCLFMVELILSVWAFGWRSGYPFSLPSRSSNLRLQDPSQIYHIHNF